MVKKSVKKKVATKKRAAPKKKAVKKTGPINTPAHPLKINSKEWDRKKVTDIVFSTLANTNYGLGKILELGYNKNKINWPLPGYTTFMRWLEEDEHIRDRYAHAHEDKTEFMAHELLEIADVVGSVVMVDGVPLMMDEKPVMALTNEAINHAKLRIDSRKWLMSKLKPKKYGDKITQEVNVFNHENALEELK